MHYNTYKEVSSMAREKEGGQHARSEYKAEDI